jgi:hypothetical protein
MFGLDQQGIRTEQLAGGATPPAGAGGEQWPPVYVQAPPWALTGLRWPPTADQLDYVQKLVTVALLLIAVPALLTALLRRPERLAAAAARKHLG